jgi:3-dehydroquinate dehydratase / shikimate dehydrogenase
MLCIPIIGPTVEIAKQQILKAAQMGDLLELRLDWFNSWTISEIEQLMRAVDLPVIFTLRKKFQGGFYSGSEGERLSKIKELAALNPDFLDLEYDLSKEFIQEIDHEHPRVKIILSFHDFDETPESLEEILAMLQKTPAHIYKIATMARSSLDALRMLTFVKRHTNLIGLCMGEHGLATRVLGLAVGGPFSFAALSENETSASGQPTAEELLTVYHVKSLNPQTKIYGLIGDPIDMSISHLFHNAIYRELGLNCVYVKFQIRPEELKEFFRLAKQLDIKGLSVTMPLKKVVMPYLDSIEARAQKIGAVNTIAIEEGLLIGYNTDAKGALDAIEAKTSVKGKKVIVIGAGGAARAIVCEACERGAEVVVLNRTKIKALELAAQFKSRGGGLEDLAEECKAGYDILVNATPDGLPIDPQWIFPGSIVMDIKTLPNISLFLQQAQEKGCTLIPGHEMFTNQAISQFKIWFKS